MKVLVLNCGSSSLKFQLIETDPESAAARTDRCLARGLVDNIGGLAVLKYEPTGGSALKETAEILEHKIAVEKALALLTRPGVGVLKSAKEIDAVGHRFVHGGEKFKSSVLIDDEVIAAFEECIDLAPLHNPPNLKGYRAARDVLPGLPQVAVFDTSFHQTMSPEAYLYALPYVLYQRHHIRRYGFHGTSHRYVARRTARLMGRGLDDPGLRIITCHLGNGCSITAIRGGRSVDTSMGFTPLEGLVMGSRSGDMDPAIILHVMGREELSPSDVNALLNKHSGLLGISGLSNDMRTLQEASPTNPRAQLAVDIFCYRLRKYVASYVGVLGGVDAVAFAGGIGENSPLVRARTMEGLDGLGLVIDEAKNAGVRGSDADITGPGSRGKVFVVPTNEELLIARDTCYIINGMEPV